MPPSPVPIAPSLDPAPSPQVAPQEALRLAEAFHIFSQASEELAGAYSELQGQVSRLSEELAAANGALRQQYQEKAALTERLSLLLDALPAGVVVLDDAGTVVQINPAASRFLGGVKVGAGWTAIESEALSPGDTPGEFLGGERRLAIAVTPLDSAGGRIVLLNDITEAQALKTRAERNQRLAAMGEMAAQLAHQLRTPLAAALLYAGNLENPELSATSTQSIANKTVARLKHIEQLIQNMLLFARGEALGRERFSVTELLGELAQNFEPLAQTRGVRFMVTDDSGGAPLTGKRESLVGALTSLLENALQALDGVNEGCIGLSARRKEGVVYLAVRDNGCGMDRATAARLFEPFYTTRSDGTGLGLAIARGVARAHGGGIEVVSDPSAGAEFILSLPCPEN
ncbi:MAG: PAS domain-containing protein [Sulfuritalea sp.]|nr:PAS domain-containing protein [Sulfuritalea sp.]